MKTAAYLIAVLIGFGIVGRMDYEDAQAFEATQVADFSERCETKVCKEITNTASANE